MPMTKNTNASQHNAKERQTITREQVLISHTYPAYSSQYDCDCVEEKEAKSCRFYYSINNY